MAVQAEVGQQRRVDADNTEEIYSAMLMAVADSEQSRYLESATRMLDRIGRKEVLKVLQD